jgi:transposase
MIVRRGFRYRIYPDQDVEDRLLRWKRSQRLLWNAALDQQMKRLETYLHGGAVTYQQIHNLEQQAQLREARALDEMFGDVPSRAQAVLLRDLDATWKLWIAGGVPLAEIDWESRMPQLERNVREERLREYDKIQRKERRLELQEEDEDEDETEKQRKREEDEEADKRKKNKRGVRGIPRPKTRGDVGLTVMVAPEFVPERHLTPGNNGLGIIRLPKVGDVKIRLHRPLRGTVRTVSIVQDAPREWYVSLMCEIDINDPGFSLLPTVAIDRGVALTLCDSDGRRALLPERIRKLARRIDREKHRNDHRIESHEVGAPRSKTWMENSAKIARDHRRVRNMRRYWLHEQALYYAMNYGVVVVESLRVRGMTATAKGSLVAPGRRVRQKAGLNRSILEQGWATFVNLLAYKMEERGGILVEVPAAYSSRTCAECGEESKKNRKGREFLCVSCGHRDHADGNASRVLLQRHQAGRSRQAGGYSVTKRVKVRINRIKGKKKQVV